MNTAKTNKNRNFTCSFGPHWLNAQKKKKQQEKYEPHKRLNEGASKRVHMCEGTQSEIKSKQNAPRAILQFVFIFACLLVVCCYWKLNVNQRSRGETSAEKQKQKQKQNRTEQKKSKSQNNLEQVCVRACVQIFFTSHRIQKHSLGNVSLDISFHFVYCKQKKTVQPIFFVIITKHSTESHSKRHWHTAMQKKVKRKINK